MLMVDYENDVLYYTPYYRVLKNFSRSMRPGDVVLGISECPNPNIHICAVAKQDGSYAINILNIGEATNLPLQLGEYSAKISLAANSVETLIVTM